MIARWDHRAIEIWQKRYSGPLTRLERSAMSSLKAILLAALLFFLTVCPVYAAVSWRRQLRPGLASKS